jgi:DNA-binding GntR family transcriptional regulator
MHELGDLFVEASDNLVLKLVRRGVTTDFIDQLDARRPHLLEPFSLSEQHFQNLANAIDARDGAAAAEVVLELTHEIRRHATESITNERERLSLERMSS